MTDAPKMSAKTERRWNLALGRLLQGRATRHDRRQVRKCLARHGRLPQYQVFGHQRPAGRELKDCDTRIQQMVAWDSAVSEAIYSALR